MEAVESTSPYKNVDACNTGYVPSVLVANGTNAVAPSRRRLRNTVVRSTRSTRRNSAWWFCHMMRMTAKLSAYATTFGHIFSSPDVNSASDGVRNCGKTIPRTSSMMAKAKTPSEKASKRCLFMQSPQSIRPVPSIGRAVTFEKDARRPRSRRAAHRIFALWEDRFETDSRMLHSCVLVRRTRRGRGRHVAGVRVFVRCEHAARPAYRANLARGNDDVRGRDVRVTPQS